MHNFASLAYRAVYNWATIEDAGVGVVSIPQEI
jgi:hypothetical protein